MAKRTPEERFWAKVNRLGPDDCWLWTGAVNNNGYGVCSSRPTKYAHRFAYELANGSIPAGLTIDHSCHNQDPTCHGGSSDPHRRCVNPAHLRAVTQRENSLASKNTTTAKHAAVTHCPHGHPYDEANTYVFRGMRRCRACNAERSRAFRRREGASRPCRVCGRPARKSGTECSACNMRRLRAARKERTG